VRDTPTQKLPATATKLISIGGEERERESERVKRSRGEREPTSSAAGGGGNDGEAETRLTRLLSVVIAR